MQERLEVHHHGVGLPHHHDHDEALLALEEGFEVYHETAPGELTFKRPRVGEGVYFNSGHPHGFHNTTSKSRRMRIVFESPLEMGFLKAGIPVEPPIDELPSAPPEVAESERVGELADEYATEALGPLPINDYVTTLVVRNNRWEG